MHCSECLLDDVVYDEASGTCYCPNCRKMWVVEEKVERDVALPIGVVLDILLSIPIVNVPLVLFLQKTNIKIEYIKCFVFKVLTSILVCMAICGFILYRGFSINDIVSAKLQERLDNIIADIKVQIVVNEGYDAEIAAKEKLIEAQREEALKKETLNSLGQLMSGNDVTNIDKVLLCLDGSYITGEKVLFLMEEYFDKKSVFLLQTKGVKEKFGDYYKVYGILPDCAIELQDSMTWYIDITKKVSFYNFKLDSRQDEYNLEVVEEFDDFSEKNKIWNINKKSKFLCMIRIDNGRKVFGFKEVIDNEN